LRVAGKPVGEQKYPIYKFKFQYITYQFNRAKNLAQSRDGRLHLFFPLELKVVRMNRLLIFIPPHFSHKKAILPFSEVNFGMMALPNFKKFYKKMFDSLTQKLTVLIMPFSKLIHSNYRDWMALSFNGVSFG